MRAARRSQAGFTLTEMMIVIAIVGVLAALAWNLLSPNADPDDIAEETAQLMREAGRRATTGGPVRGDVVTALGLAPKPSRARLHVIAGTPRKIAIERLQVDPLPQHTASWVQVQAFTVPSAVTLKGWRATADLNGGQGPSVLLSSTDEVVIQCYANSTCDAATLYFDLSASQGGSAPARTVVMPLGGSPVVYESW